MNEIIFRIMRASVCLAILVSGASPLFAQKKEVVDIKPKYPRINLAPWYEVDPKWPQKPAQLKWADMPGIAVDQQDQVWIFTRSKPPIQVYTTDGKFVRAWGDDTIGNAHHLKIDRDGNVWIADIGWHVIRKFSPNGEIFLTVGVAGELGADETHFNQPTDMAIAPNGEIFVSDGYRNNRIVHLDSQGKFIKQWGQLGVGPTDFSLPHAIAMDSRGHLYVADRNNVRVQVYDQRGKLLDSWRDVIVPWGFWITPKDEIWVCGSSPMPWRDDSAYPGAPVGCPPRDQLLMKFNPDGRLLQLWTMPKGEDGKENPGDVNWLHALAVDSKGDIYVGDIIGKRAQKFVRKK
jgi:NHL repeat-containing protein